MLIALIEIGIIKYAYEKIGINPRYVFALLLLSLLGSYVNIPVAELPAERVLSGEEIIFFGMRYVIPLVEEWPRTAPEVTVAPHGDGLTLLRLRASHWPQQAISREPRALNSGILKSGLWQR